MADLVGAAEQMGSLGTLAYSGATQFYRVDFMFWVPPQNLKNIFHPQPLEPPFLLSIFNIELV